MLFRPGWGRTYRFQTFELFRSLLLNEKSAGMAVPTLLNK